LENVYHASTARRVSGGVRRKARPQRLTLCADKNFVREEITMRLTATRALALAVGVTGAAFAALQAAPPASGQSGPGWVQLFDGKTLDGWDMSGQANWRVEDGAIVADKLMQEKGTAHLVTKNKYKDHMIHAEFWASDDANSGIFVRCSDPKTVGARTCYEVNIFDRRKDPSYGTGAIVYFSEVNPMPKAGGKWNTFEITAKGRHIVVLLNGQKTADLHNGLFEEGPFTLQYGAGVIKWRKVAVKPL
jgi:hypothetical protein